MDIAYLRPLGRAWTRMKYILFNPFDFAKWIVLGFTAWLADLTDISSSTGGGGRFSGDHDFSDWSRRGSDIVESIRDFLVHGIEAALIVMIIIVAIALWIVLMWLSSRGSFMFLDNVVHNRAKVKEPWRRFKNLGDSLFLWRFVFSLICFVVFAGLAGFTLLVCLPMIGSESAAVVRIPALIVLGCTFLLLGVVTAYIDFFLMHCVVPVMYKHELRATTAWKRLMVLLSRHLGYFLLFGLFFLLLYICFGVAVVLLGLVTCCIGWLILAIPVVGSILLLPVHVTFRLFDLEFLAQFGSEYDVLEAAETAPSDTT